MISEAFTPKLLTTFGEGYGSARLRANVIAGLTVGDLGANPFLSKPRTQSDH